MTINLCVFLLFSNLYKVALTKFQAEPLGYLMAANRPNYNIIFINMQIQKE